jgi:hypothetical protein
VEVGAVDPESFLDDAALDEVNGGAFLLNV